MSYSKDELVQYRVDRAKESYGDAKVLVKMERWNAAANRMYYSCFYIVSAYLAFKGMKAATHTGLKSAFNRELIKPGKIDRADGVLYNRLFAIRQQADYEDFADIQPDEIKPLLAKINDLIGGVEALIFESNDR